MKFLKGFLVFILIAIIVGGIGYIGYSFLFADHSGHNTTASQTQQSTEANSNSDQNQQSMQGMQQGSSKQQSQQNSSSQQSGSNQNALTQSNYVLQNKEKLDKSISLINESQRLMSVDPYAPASSAGSMGGMNIQPQAGQPVQGNTPTTTNPGNNTIVNIFPQGSSSNTQNNTMQNMGTTYDPSKMEQLHSGLYKIAVGRALLDQLKNELDYQAEFAASNAQNTAQYYLNQYNLTQQDKNKLSQALTYINEAANLININPYVSTNGLVYDKDRMSQIHQSVLRLAEGVVAINQLSDDFTRQTVYLSNMAQYYMNNPDTQPMNMNMSNGLFGGLFDNISMSSMVNIILILFVIGLVFGIFGFIASLLKPPAKRPDEMI